MALMFFPLPQEPKLLCYFRLLFIAPLIYRLHLGILPFSTQISIHAVRHSALVKYRYYVILHYFSTMNRMPSNFSWNVVRWLRNAQALKEVIRMFRSNRTKLTDFFHLGLGMIENLIINVTGVQVIK